MTMNYRLMPGLVAACLAVSVVLAEADDTVGSSRRGFRWPWERDVAAERESKESVDAANPAQEQASLLAQNIDELVEEALIEELAADVAPASGETAEAVADPDATVALQAKLDQAEADKARMAEELRELGQKIEELNARPPEAAAPKKGVAPGSDLFAALERENAELKKKVAALEDEKAKAIEERQELEEATRKREEELDQIEKFRDAERKDQKTLEALVKDMPKMEQELVRLRSEAKEKEAILKDREEALQAMAVELQRREHRLIKAERMSDMIEKARSDLKQVSSQEKRDMHYNMAAVYTREGKFEDAEREYLRALRIDPADADTHYNLGILYDEHLDQVRKASMHYQRYLRLRPHADDVDRVKEWLLGLDMGVRQ